MLKRNNKLVSISAAITLGLYLLFSSFYTVEEGHVGIVKRFGEAIYQVDPGLRFKVPFADTFEELEVRTRKNVESMPAATSEQMPVTATVSMNWTVNKSQALELYKEYGGLDQFENRIIDPRLRSASKDAIAKLDAENLVINRTKATHMAQEQLLKDLASFPIKVDSIQLENIQLPGNYLHSIETKQTEKNLADAENHKLAKQALTVQQTVNTANANRDAAKAAADGKAYTITVEAAAQAEAIKLVGEAEAEAIKARAQAIGSNSVLVDYQKALSWDGKLPTSTTTIGNGQATLLNLK